jgi:hypothetical protein
MSNYYKEILEDEYKENWRNYVGDRINQEGLTYAIIHWSEFKEVPDKKFHKLRLAYIKAAKKLASHIGIEL